MASTTPVSPHGSSLVTASWDGTAKLWEAVPWPALAAIGDNSVSFDQRLHRFREGEL